MEEIVQLNRIRCASENVHGSDSAEHTCNDFFDDFFCSLGRSIIPADSHCTDLERRHTLDRVDTESLIERKGSILQTSIEGMDFPAISSLCPGFPFRGTNQASVAKKTHLIVFLLLIYMDISICLAILGVLTRLTSTTVLQQLAKKLDISIRNFDGTFSYNICIFAPIQERPWWLVKKPKCDGSFPFTISRIHTDSRSDNIE